MEDFLRFTIPST